MKTVGILGGGQLARMLALAGHPLGLRFRVFDPSPQPPAAVVAEHVRAAWNDREALARFCDGLAVATFELEGVAAATARAVEARVPLHPSPRALDATRDRLGEKEFARSLDIATAPFARVDTASAVGAALARVGTPAILKSRSEGYDGRGQSLVRSADEAREAFERGGRRPALLEGLVPFRRELSLLAVRDRRGRTAWYPLVENQHRGGILHRSEAPAAAVSPALEAEAHEIAGRVLTALDYVGVITFELFDVGERLLLNEIAPRVHNSGHWTIEGAVTSQFENHVRAVAGLPLGSCRTRCASVLRNILGRLPDAASVLAVPGAHLHLYGKEPREGRKLGHVTITADDDASLAERERQVAEALEAVARISHSQPRAVEPPRACAPPPAAGASVEDLR